MYKLAMVLFLIHKSLYHPISMLCRHTVSGISITENSANGATRELIAVDLYV